MNQESKDKIENTIEYLTLKITFPDLDNSDESLFIYKKTLEQLATIETEDILLHLGQNSSLYNDEVDYCLCNTNNKKLDFPKIKLIYKHQELDLPDISINTRILFPKFYFESLENSWLSITKERSIIPPCDLKELTIEVIGDFIYYDINRLDKVFNLLSLKGN